MIRFHFRKQVANTARFQLEHTFGLTTLKQLEGRFILQREVQNINSLARRLFDQVDRVAQHRQRLQAQEVHLQQPGCLDIVHRPLSNDILFARHSPQRHVVRQRSVTDHHRCSMRPNVSRQTFKLFCEVQQFGDFRIAFVDRPQFLAGFDGFFKCDSQLVWHHPSNLIDSRQGNPKCTPDVLDGCPSLHRAEGTNLRDALFAILFLDVLHDVGTTFLAEVDIDIRGLQTIFI